MDQITTEQLDKLQELYKFRKRKHTKVLETNKRRREQILDYIKTYFDHNGYVPTQREICRELDLSGPKSLKILLKELELLNFISVKKDYGKRLSRNLMLNKNVSIPVIPRTHSSEPIETITIDLRLFELPPHYALRMDAVDCSDVYSGTYTLVHSPTDVSGNKTVVEWHDGGLKFAKRTYGSLEKPRFKHEMDGIVVGSIQMLTTNN